MENILNKFIDWARTNSPDAWYIFENQDEAIKLFMKYYKEKNG